jgi:PAS domain-containing protein
MKTSLTTISILIRSFYVLVLLVFFFALFKIVEGRSQASGGLSVNLESNSDRSSHGFQLVDYSPGRSSIGLAATLPHINVTFFNNQLMFFGVLCSVSFLLVYAGFPVYNFLFINKPVREINHQLVTGHLTPIQGVLVNRSVKKLYENAASTVRYKESTRQILNGISKREGEGIDVQESGSSLAALQQRLNEISEGEKTMTLINSNVQQLENILKAESDWQTLVTKLITFLAKSTNGGVGAIYEWENTVEEAFFHIAGSYGFYDNRKTDKKISADHGQLGEITRQRKMVFLKNVPSGYLVIHSGLGSAPATHIIIAPLLFKGELYGAVELGFFKHPEPFEIKWLERACESIAAHFFNHKINREAKHQLEVLAQRQAAELVEIHTLQQQTYRELELKLREMEEEKRKNEMILEGCVDGVLVFDTKGKITFCNEAARELLNTRREVILGQSVSSLFPVMINQDAARWKVVYTKAGVEKEISVRTETSLPLYDQSNIDVLITCTQARLQSGVVFTFFIQKISVDLF